MHELWHTASMDTLGTHRQLRRRTPAWSAHTHDDHTGGQSSLQRARFDLCKVVVIAGGKVDVLQASYLLRSDHGAPPKIAPVPSSVTRTPEKDRCQPSRSCKGHFHFDCSRAWLERSFDVMRDLQNSLPYLASTCV